MVRNLLAGTLVLLLASGCVNKVKDNFEQGDLHYRAGIQHLSSGELLKAKSELDLAVSLYDKDPNYFNALGLVHLGMNNYEIAVSKFLEALRIGSGIPDIHNNLGTAYYHLGQYDAAIEEHRLALDYPNYRSPAAALFNIGLAYEGKGDKLTALEYFAKAIEKQPEFYRPYVRRANLYLENGQYKAAWKEISQAGRLNAEDPEVHYTAGVILLKQGKKEKAIKAFERTFDISDKTEFHEKARQQLEAINAGNAPAADDEGNNPFSYLE